jgi:hypothetical protein
MKKWALFALLSTIVLYPLLASAEDDHYARGIVIQSLVPNKLGVGGAEFKTKNNTKGDGIFVFNPKTEFNGTKRYLIWLVIKDEAYPLNGPSKMITPDLKWPREANPDIWKKTGLDPYIATEAIEIVYGQK